MTVVLALARDEDVSPGDVIMLEDIGAALVLSVGSADGSAGVPDGEQSLTLEVEAFAPGNTAPDIP